MMLSSRTPFGRSGRRGNLTVRDAVVGDIPVLAGLKAPAVLHEDRIRDAGHGEFRYLVLVNDSEEILGHACLVFRLPRTWPPNEESTPCPRVVDLLIHGQRRRQGLGTAFMRGIEAICGQRGCDRLHLSVDPKGNADALGFYLALGYRAAEEEAQWRRWSFTDSQGNLHRGEGPELDMFRKIG